MSTITVANIVTPSGSPLTLASATGVVAVQGALIVPTPSVATGLSTNSTLTFQLTSNTNLRVLARGTDGVTRYSDLTLSTFGV